MMPAGEGAEKLQQQQWQRLAAGGDAAAQLNRMRRDLEKIYCGLWPSQLESPADPDGACPAAAAIDPSFAGRTVVTESATQLDAVLLLLAGSEAHCATVEVR